MASRADNGFELEFAVFLCFEWQHKCLPVVFGKAETQILLFGAFLLFYFFNCGNAVFPKTEKTLSHLLDCSGQRIISYEAFQIPCRTN